MKSFLRNFSSCFAFPTRRPSALERAVRSTPQGRRLRLEALENRSLLAVDALGAAASLDVGESWGPEPEPAFSASELASAAEASPSISLAALNAVPFGPYVTSEQAALIASRSNATLADETIADFGSLWDELDAAETPDVSSCALTVVGETLALEPLDLGEIEQEPLPGDAAPASGGTGQSGGGGIAVHTSGGNAVGSGALAFATDAAISEDNEEVIFYFFGNSTLANTTISAVVSGVDPSDYAMSETLIHLDEQGFGSFTFQSVSDALYEGDEVATITLSASGSATLSKSVFTITIVDDPEFISPADAASANSAIVNDDVFHGEFLDTSNVALNTGVTLFTPSIHRAHAVSYGWSVSGTGAGALEMDPSTGVVTYKAEDASEKYGNVVVTLTASYVGNSALNDTIELYLRWGDVSAAKSVISQWRDTAKQNTSEWFTASNRCESFANYFETYVRQRLAYYPSVNCCVNSAAGVTFSVDAWFNPLTTKHAAVRIIYQNGDELFYDVDTFGGVFPLSGIPDYATPDF